MNELLIAIFYISCFLVLFPFIVYCIMVFIDKYDKIHYMKDYVYRLKHHDMQEWFTIPILNIMVSIYVIFVFILLCIEKLMKFIWNKIPKISVFENKCTNIWERFSDWFMNIKIK